ncbi:MAG: acyltransferase [Caldimonas sp.]
MAGLPEGSLAAAPRLGYIDSLRGFAAVYVVVFHMSRVPKPAPPVPGWLQTFVDFGGSGVTLFFVISGFSMCLTWDSHVRTGSPLRSFYVTRFFRIAPLLYFWLPLYLLRDFAFKGAAGVHSLAEVAANVLFVFNVHEPFQDGIVWASWTIGVEMMFYAIFPLIARYAATLARSTLLMLGATWVVVALGPASGDTPAGSTLHALTTGHGFLTSLPSFLVGTVVYHLVHRDNFPSDRRERKAFGYFLLLGSIAGLAAIAMNAWSYFLCPICYGGVLIACSMIGPTMWLGRATRHIGQISYSLYLNHPNLVYALGPVFMGIYGMGAGLTPSFLACMVLTFLILVPMSNLTFRLVEKPMMIAGKKWATPSARLRPS